MTTETVPELFTWSYAQPKIQELLGDFSPTQNRVRLNREERHKDVSIKNLRRSKMLKANQFMLVVRIIDSNILREIPAYLNYLVNSPRIAVFRDVENPNANTTTIEAEFSRGLTYPSWEIPFIKAVDGSLTHGWDFCEVQFDPSKPCHVNVEHVGTDNLVFHKDTVDIQEQEFILRRYFVTAQKLELFVTKYGFSQEQVETVKTRLKESRQTTIKVYKKYCKYDGVVYVSWACPDLCSDWLKAPEPLFLGRTQQAINEFGLPTEQPIPETAYPVFFLPYSETEQLRIVEHVGRVFKDRHKQEAMSANLSQFINSCQNASELYMSLKATTEKSPGSLESIEISSGKIPPIPIEFYHPDFPDPVMLNLAQYLEVMNSQEVGQVNYAVQNRKDTRKTAAELMLAKEESVKLSSTQLIVFSTFLRDIFSFCWMIIQNRASQGKFKFLSLPPSPEALVASELQGQAGGVTNNNEVILRDYDVRAAGDVDVVRRLELIALYEKYWPIVGPTAAGPVFLARLLSLAFGQEGTIYSTIISQGDPANLLAKLSNMVTAILPEIAPQLTPEVLAQVNQLLMETNNYVSARSSGGVGEQSSGDSQPAEQQTIS